MSLDICFYFQVHQPWRLRHYTYKDIGHAHDYFDDAANAAILRRVAQHCYLPMNALLLDAIRAHAPHFRVSFSITTTALQQMVAWAPQVLLSFRELLATGAVELLTETSHHSLAALHDAREFAAQVRLHQASCAQLLGACAGSFRNTELITSDRVLTQVAAMGFGGVCIEGAERLLRGRSASHAYRFSAAPGLAALPRHYRLSDDLAFRFSDRHWSAWPLTATRYADWLQSEAEARPAQGGFIGLYMDYETFGEHQWADSGIFAFMRALPGELLRRGCFRFVTPTQAARATPADAARLDLPQAISWADQERDTSAWNGNAIQRAALARCYGLADSLRHMPAAADAAALLEDWRRLQTSDHFYYMATKHWSDGDVHKYFSPYESPYAACINYMNVMDDLAGRCGPPR
ncbi:glycoside hydrolase family 57 protein [Metallibacterium sp.]|uniref:glycoside hydrolase family 57 protein n=1 Tax=Metallibacterium sp. TaxID=2940281 RepID=UPI0026033135|nr:glycoside hydrolase family 57 protein [Metallibacterium sp.]